jgi:hypothetical protein
LDRAISIRPTRRDMKVSSAVAEFLRREGIDVIFCYPRNPVLEEAAAIGIGPVAQAGLPTLLQVMAARETGGSRL